MRRLQVRIRYNPMRCELRVVKSSPLGMFGVSLLLAVISLVGTMGVSWVYWIHQAPDCGHEVSRGGHCNTGDLEADSSQDQNIASVRRGPSVRLDFGNLSDFNKPQQRGFTDRNLELRRTWDAAQIYVVYGDLKVFGRFGDANIQERLAMLPNGVKFPTIIYLHDCVLPRWPGPYHFWVRLAQSGYVLIAPDGFARANRSRTCDREHMQLELRLEELQFAIDQITDLTWVDQHNLFLIGHSEGGEAAGRYLGEAFKGIVITSANCSTRGRDSFTTPLLAVASMSDSWLEGLGPYCARADERVLIQGSTHGVLVYPQVQKAIHGFILRHTDARWP